MIGLSGGIDSALVAKIAADALGPENVLGVSMPGPYSSDSSLRDARTTGPESRHPIRRSADQRFVLRLPPHARSTHSTGKAEDVTEENHPGAHSRQSSDGDFE